MSRCLAWSVDPTEGERSDRRSQAKHKKKNASATGSTDGAAPRDETPPPPSGPRTSLGAGVVRPGHAGATNATAVTVPARSFVFDGVQWVSDAATLTVALPEAAAETGFSVSGGASSTLRCDAAPNATIVLDAVAAG